MKAELASGHTCAGIAALALAAVAGWTAWGAPALVPAPRQMKLTGGEYVAKTTWTGEIPIHETVDASLPNARPATFLTASTSLSGNAPTLELDDSYGQWRCVKVGQLAQVRRCSRHDADFQVGYIGGML